jgi:ATP-dependent Clp protease ATP-binding subunit ClpA
MFEKYNEKARRTIFFARYEASAFGSPVIETEHLLLGLIREDKSILTYYLGDRTTSVGMREAILKLIEMKPSTPTHIDLPLSNECKRILAYGAEEAMRLDSKDIETPHLMLGILREEQCFAARMLRENGLRLEEARAMVRKAEKTGTGGSGGGTGYLRSSATLYSTASGQVPTIRVVGDATSETLARLANFSTLPRIGEAVVIRQADDAAKEYRVKDVLWEYRQNADAATLGEIVLKVVEDGS